jgi:predicted nucleic acid-binding protein
VRIFLDANILFSAAKSNGAVRDLLHRLQQSGHELGADAYVAAEARRNLSHKESEALETLEALIARLEVASFQPGNSLPDAARVLPEKDQPVLAAAIRMRCAALVTGDRTHFSVLYGKSVALVTIYSRWRHERRAQRPRTLGAGGGRGCPHAPGRTARTGAQTQGGRVRSFTKSVVEDAQRPPSQPCA